MQVEQLKDLRYLEFQEQRVQHMLIVLEMKIERK